MPTIQFITKISEEGVIQTFDSISKAIEKTADDSEKLSKSSTENAEKMSVSWSQVGVAFAVTGTAIAAAGVSVIATLFEMAESTSKLGAEMHDMSERTGLSSSALSEFGYAAGLSGASLDNVIMGLRLLATHMEDVVSKGDLAGSMFTKLGISVTDVHGALRPTSEVLLDVADKFHDMDDGARKSAIAVELFGRGGLALIPMLNEGRAGISKMAAEAHRLGIVFDTEASAKADKFDDALFTLHQSVVGLTRAIGEEAYPILLKWIQGVTDIIVKTKDWVAANPKLSSGLLEIATAMVGGGGVLIGLGGMITILPKSIELMGTFGTTTAVGTGILGNFASGLKLVSGALAGVFTAGNIVIGGLVGIAAEVGIVIGSFINWGLEVTGLQKGTDSLLASVLNFNKSAIGTWLTGQDSVIAATKLSADATDKLKASLDKAGVSYDAARLSDSKYVGELGQQLLAIKAGTASHVDFTAAIKAFTAAQDTATLATKEARQDQSKANDEYYSGLVNFYNNQRALGKISNDDLTNDLIFAETNRYAAENHADGNLQELQAKHQAALQKIQLDSNTAIHALMMAQQQQTESDIKQIEADQLASQESRLTAAGSYNDRLYALGKLSNNDLYDQQQELENQRYQLQLNAHGFTEAAEQDHVNKLFDIWLNYGDRERAEKIRQQTQDEADIKQYQADQQGAQQARMDSQVSFSQNLYSQGLVSNAELTALEKTNENERYQMQLAAHGYLEADEAEHLARLFALTQDAGARDRAEKLRQQAQDEADVTQYNSDLQGARESQLSAEENQATRMFALHQISADQLYGLQVLMENKRYQQQLDANGYTQTAEQNHLNKLEELDNGYADYLDRYAIRIRNAWEGSIKGFVDDATGEFARMVVNWDFTGSSMVDIWKKALSDMLGAFIDGLFSPITDKLAQLGGQLAAALLGGTNSGIDTAALTTAGFTKDAAGGLLGAVGLTGGITGIGSAAGTTSLLGLGGSTSALGGLGGLLTNPITGIIAGAALAATAWVKSQAHWEANDIVQNIQNPFDAKFSEMINAVVANQGTMSSADLRDSYAQIHDFWAATTDTVQGWAAGSSDRGTAASQFFETEIPFVTKWFDWLSSLAAGKLAAETAPATIGATGATAPATQSGILEYNPTGIYYDELGVMHTGGLPLAGGMDYVPYDNFPALLHRGERVQTAAQARDGGGVTVSIGDVHVYGAPSDDPEAFAAKMMDAVRRQLMLSGEFKTMIQGRSGVAV